MNNYHIPRTHIFQSRDQTFQRDVLEATGGRGVDVVLNSVRRPSRAPVVLGPMLIYAQLSGELLHASWQCVAEFGCMVEIGKRDLVGKGSLALDLFERNRSYFGVDFAQICGERPEIASRQVQYRCIISSLALIYWQVAQEDDGFLRPGRHWACPPDHSIPGQRD